MTQMKVSEIESLLEREGFELNTEDIDDTGYGYRQYTREDGDWLAYITVSVKEGDRHG